MQWLLLGSIVSLPLNLFVNNLLFTVFFIGFTLKILLNDPKELLTILKRRFPLFLLLVGPLLITLIGCLYTTEPAAGFKDLGRLVPLALIIPAVLYAPGFFSAYLKRLVYALAIGCLAAALICWSLTLAEMYSTGYDLGDLFTPRFAYHELSGRIDIHTPYLGMFTAIAIFFLITEFVRSTTKKAKLLYFIWAAILLLFLFNLLARTATVTLVIGTFAYMIYTKRYALIVLGAAVVITAGSLAYWQDHNFLRDRIFKSINLFESETIFSKKDGRFERFGASIVVFKQFPLLGPGTAAEDTYRKAAYYDNRDSVAYNANYNAHNQFLEYLSTFGLLGGLVFLALLIVLIRAAWGHPILLFFAFSFIMAGLTESILERSWGISFYLLLVMLIFGSKFSTDEQV